MSGGAIASARCSHHLVVPWTWFCGGELAPAETEFACFSWMTKEMSRSSSSPGIQPTTCLRQAIVCFTQMLLILAFYVFLASFRSTLPGALSRSEMLQAFEVGSILYNVTAVLSGLVGVAFLSSGVWVVIATGDALLPHTWVPLLVQGVAWTTIAFSLRIRLRNPTKQVAYVWWILTFLLATLTMFLATLDLLAEASTLSAEVCILIASWPVSCLLLTCAISGERWILVEIPDDGGLTEQFSAARTLETP